MRYTYLLLICLVLPAVLQAKNPVIISNEHQESSIINNYSYYYSIDKALSNEITIPNQTFIPTNKNIPLFPVGVNDVWIKFSVLNKTSVNELYLNVRYSNLSKLTLYKNANGRVLQKIGMAGNIFRAASELANGFVFPFSQNTSAEETYFLHIESAHPIIAPAYVCTYTTLTKEKELQIAINALYAGIMGVMIIYNLFVYFSIKDKTYLVYVIYTLFLLLAQFSSTGYLFYYLWPSYPKLNLYAVVWTSSISFVAGILFEIYFLQVKKRSPVFYRIMLLILVSFSVGLFCNISGFINASYTLLNFNSIAIGAVTLLAAAKIARSGYKPAYLYLFAWSSVLVGLIILALRNFGMISYNAFTSNIVYIVTAAETVFLSIALADKINIFRREKESSQAEGLHMAKENQKLIEEQNIMLEQQVAERTYDLEKTLRELKDAQIQLVESEKMASLGQLTAGIAHEINNPINFVKSNVSPLQMDVQDLFELITEYQKLHDSGAEAQPGMLKKIRVLENKLDPDFLKEEIESLIGGIEEGAERTAEIVRGLRSFSRLDESECKEVNVYENINSTLVLLRNNMPPYIKIRKYFEARPQIECYPGKLNQVFMNILSNSIHAINAKPVKNREEYIDIATEEAGDYMQIRISDTGIGMTEEIKHKIFEPFFTTKDVGEGTGLGMAIVFKIIAKHDGRISVQSSPGEGAAFTIEIPYLLRSEINVTENEITETEEADL